MSYVDWLLLGIIAVSLLVGCLRGFVKEVFALAVWAAAFFVAFQFSGVMAEHLAEPGQPALGAQCAGLRRLFLLVLLSAAC